LLGDTPARKKKRGGAVDIPRGQTKNLENFSSLSESKMENICMNSTKAERTSWARKKRCTSWYSRRQAYG
jgi:hypothetical protein